MTETRSAPTHTDTSWQFVSDDPWTPGHWVTFTDKLLGLEVCTNGPRKETVCVPIPPQHVLTLAFALLRWVTSGNIAIARGGDRR